MTHHYIGSVMVYLYNKVTTPSRLVSRGNSNGSLLVAVAAL
jgi:hypothetical protein